MLKSEWRRMVSELDSDNIEFATVRPPGSPFVMLERWVVVTGPAELVLLSKIGDREILQALVELLPNRQQAWAAVVLLAAMTRGQGREVDNYATDPTGWWESFGDSAYDSWKGWLEDVWDRLEWDEGKGAFVVI